MTDSIGSSAWFSNLFRSAQSWWSAWRHTDNAAPPAPDAFGICVIDNASTANLSNILVAIQIQLNRDYVPRWAPGKSFKVYVPNSNIGKRELVIYMGAGYPSNPLSLGWHQYGGVGFVATDRCLRDGREVSEVLSHEILEMVHNPSASDDGQEICDPVHRENYLINGIAVSDFVFSPYFDPNGKGQLDYCQKISKPGQILL